MIKNKNIFSIVLIVLILALFFIPSSQAALVGNTNQATLTAMPQTGNYNINDNFPVSVYVNTHGQSVVVVAAYLNYDKASFEAVSINTTGSVFTMEAEKIIDSTNGVIKITRGIPSPGVNTANGLVAVINFRAIAVTSPSSDNLTFQFTAGSTLESNVILNDGLGTDYLSGVYNALFTVSSLPTFNFSLSTNPTSGTIIQGQSTITTITADLVSGSSQSVSFSLSGLPSEASASFSPASCNPTCNSTLTITTSGTTPAGTYATTITGTGGGLIRTASYNLTVSSSLPLPSCNDCGLGTPTVTPASPFANTGFTITCSANNSGYDCIDAYVNETICSFSQWSGNNAIFNCQGAAAGSYTAKRAAKTGTGQNCCVDQKTASFSVSSPPPPPPPSPSPSPSPSPTDTEAPVISDIKVSETTFSSMTIIWKTNEPATSQVEYGTTKDYGLFSPLSTSLTTSHLVKITGLAQKTNYYFRVISKDGSGNQSLSAGSTFSTQSRPKLMGDFNSDGKVNIYDLSVLLSNWKKAKPEYDLNEDRLVNIFDLSILLSNWTK